MTHRTATLPLRPACRDERDAGRPASPQAEDDGRSLLQCLGELRGLLTQLAELARQKLEAMRRADADALQRIASHEWGLIDQVQRTRRQRQAVLARLAQSLHWPDAVTARLDDVAARLSEPLASSIRARTVALREIAAHLEQKNRLAARVARDLQKHVRGVFAELVKAGQELAVYGPQGRHERTSTRAWVDAVG